MQIGDIVKITEGPLAGRLARFAGNAEERVWVVVEMHGRQLDVEMDLDWIAATAPGRKSAAGIEARRNQMRSKPLT